MKIVIYSPADDGPHWCAAMSAHFPGAEVWTWNIGDALRQADYAIAWAPPSALFAAADPFRAIFTMGAGVDKLLRMPDLGTLTRGAPIVRLNDAGMAVQMAEYVLHALVRHVRGLDRYEKQQVAGDWQKWPFVARRPFTVGVMGLGSIGAQVARTVAGLGYPVLGWSRSARDVPGVETFHGSAALGGFLRRTRVLVCVLPLTPQTEGILNRENLARLMPGAYVINVARGQHVVDADLIGLIDEGHLSGAMLDVFHEEPLPAGHPFWAHPKIGITPHISALTVVEESAAQIAEKIRRIEAGHPAETIEGVVRPELGY
jgi:glyoxylate/hydroxypyruvate reductase A